MASSTTSTVGTDQEYNDKKEEVQSQIKNGIKIEAVALYSLASLLARCRPNDTLPVCLLCHKISVAKKVFGLGHLIPHSILKQCGLTYSADVNQGKESGVSKMGYRAFCSDCEKKFSKHGELHLNEKFFKPFHQKQSEAIEVNVRDRNGNPWLYFCLISIVWRCLCFVPQVKDFLNTLECLRKFLLQYPVYPSYDDIESKVTLFAFATNNQLESKCEKENATYKHFFNGMCTSITSICHLNGTNHTAAWVFMGPIHILMIYKGSDGNLEGQFGLTKDDLDLAKQLCIIKSTNAMISIRNKQDRFFPMSVYEYIVNIGRTALSDTTRVHPSKKTETDSTLPPVLATHLFLLPKSANYANGNFSIPNSCQATFSNDNRVPGMKIVGARRGEDEKIIFVAIEGAIVSGETAGPLAMALNVDDNENVKVSYLEGVYIPPKEKFCGLDLTEIPYKQIIEETMDQLIEDGVVKW